MNKLKIMLIALSFIFPLSSFAIDYYEISDNSGVFYSPYSGAYTKDGVSDDKIVLTKCVSNGNNGFSVYSYKDKELNLNSDFEFLYNKKLYGIDNKNLKYFEIIYKNSGFVENQLSYEETEKLFTDADVIKISDFKNGRYRVLNVCKDKKILLYNDTDNCFDGYGIKPQKFSSDKNIKGLIKLPYWGRVVFSSNDDKKSTPNLIIKVR